MRLLVYHRKGKILYNGQFSRSCRYVNRFPGCHLLKNRLALSRTDKACYSGKQNTASSIHPKQFLYKQNFKRSNFIHLFCKTCNGVKLFHRAMKKVNKCPNELKQPLESTFHRENVSTNKIYVVFFTSIRWLVVLILKATRSKMKKLPFSLAAMKLCSSMLPATPAVPTQTSFQAANKYIFGWKNPTAFPPKDCALLHLVLVSRYSLSNRPQVSMVYRLINHAGCWKNTRRICKSRAAGEWFTNSLKAWTAFEPMTSACMWYWFSALPTELLFSVKGLSF